MFDAEIYIQEYQQAEHGAPSLRALKKGIQAADDAHNDEWSFRFRERYMHEATFETDVIDGLVMFPEMMALYDRSEELQEDEEYLHKLLWCFKWILTDAADFHNISMEQIERFFAEFKKRLEANGKSLRPYYYLREDNSLTTHNLLPAASYRKYREYPEDDLKDCRACEASQDVTAALALDDRELAETLSQPIFSGELRCAEIPQRTYCAWIEYDIRHGDYIHARRFAKRLYPMVRNEMKMLYVSGVLLRLYAKIDRTTGVLIFRRELKNYMTCRDHSHRLSFASGAYHLFKEISNDSFTLVLPADFPLWNADNRYETAAMRDYFYAQAKELAERFDARNGNSAETALLEREDPAFDEEAPDLISGFAEGIPSVMGAVCMTLPETLTVDSVKETIETDGRFRVELAKTDEEQGLLAFQITDGSDSEDIYQVIVVCQPKPDFRDLRPASPVSDTLEADYEKAEGVVLFVMPFEEKAPDLALHFQIKLMQLICPDMICAVDITREKLLPAGWVLLTARSEVPPLVDYLYALQLHGNPENDHIWIRTVGLRACGLREIEIVDATKDNYPRYCDLLCFVTERILLRGESEDARAPFTALRRDDGSPIVCTWLPASQAGADFPAGDAAGWTVRMETLGEAAPELDDDAILFLYDGEAPDGSPKHRRLTFSDAEFERFRYGTYIVSDRKIAAIARENYDLMRALLTKDPEGAYVCVFVQKDGERDEVWMQLRDAGDAQITGLLTDDCIVGSAGETYTAERRDLTDFSVRMQGGLVIRPNTAYIAMDLD